MMTLAIFIAHAQEEMSEIYKKEIDHSFDYTANGNEEKDDYSYASSSKEVTVFNNLTGEILWNKKYSDISKELGKHFHTYESLKLIPRSNVEPTAIFLRSQMLIKKKSNGLVTARLAIDGSRQPRASYNDTYAGTSDTTNRAFILSVYLADASHRNCLDSLLLGDFDFPGAFLHNKLTREMTNGHQLIATLPSDLPKHLAGKLAEITGCCYGIRQANHEYDKDLVNLLTTNGFMPTASDHHSFYK